MCGALKDVERNHDIGGKNSYGLDSGSIYAPEKMRDENGEAAEDDEELKGCEQRVVRGMA